MRHQYIHIFFLGFCSLLSTSLCAQAALTKTRADSLVKDARDLIRTDIDSSLYLFDQLLTIYPSNDDQLELYSLYFNGFKSRGGYESAMPLFQRALRLKPSVKNIEVYGYIMNVKLIAHRQMNQYDSVTTLSEQIIALAQKLDQDWLLIDAYVERGINFERMGDYASALENFKLAERLVEVGGDLKEKSTVYTNISNYFQTIDEKEDALIYGKKALEVVQELNDLNVTAQIANNVGLVFDDLKQFDSAQYYYEIALEAALISGNEFGEHVTKLNMGLNAYRNQDYQAAIPYFYEVTIFFEKIGDNYGLALCYYNYSRIYYALDQLELAAANGEKGYQLAKENDLIRLVGEIAETLAKIYDKQLNYKKAYDMVFEYTIIRDSLVNADKNREIGRLESRLELEQARIENKGLVQEQEIKESELATTRLAILAVSLLLAVAIIALLLYTRSNRRLTTSRQVVQEQANRLEELNHLKSQFFANISHELRTPLTLIRGQLEWLKQSKVSLESEERIKNALRSSNQLGNMIEDLLDLSKVELGKQQIHLVPSETNAMLSRIVGSFQSFAESRQLSLVFKDQTQTPVFANIDIRQFEKVINNLLYNSFKFTSRGGSVEVKLSQIKDDVQIEVADDGRGIDAKELPNVFDRFYQSGSSDGGDPGSGLGLAIAKEIVGLHSGTIKVKSALGKGTTFSIQLPRTAPPATQSSDKASVNLSIEDLISQKWVKGKLHKPKVLIAEDNDEMLTYLKEVLSGYFEIKTVNNGTEALEALSVQVPDLILSDVMMPKMDGFELLEALKSNVSYQQIPVILLTARSAQEDRMQGLRLGVDDYITKPFDREELLIRMINVSANLEQRLSLANDPNKPETSSNVQETSLSLEDDKLIRKAENFVESKIDNSKLKVADIAYHLGVSERQLYRKLNTLTGLTPAQFLNEVRLQYARKLLINKKYQKVEPLATAVGFSSGAYFSKLYYERFGKRPVELL
ncbi:MAG: response regulator [Cyclobacteriaceae bacterium]